MRQEGDRYTTRVFQAGLATFALVSNDETMVIATARMFGDLPPAEVAEAVLIATQHDLGWTLHRRGSEGQRSYATAQDLLIDLISVINRYALDCEPERLHLHAGAVTKDGHGLVLSGPSGHGKSTVAAALAFRGWTYLSDESVSIAAGDDVVQAFPKPVNLKRGSFASFASELEALEGFDPNGHQHALVPLGAFGVNVAPQMIPTCVAVLSLTDPKPESAQIHPISPADSVVHLLEQTLDPGRYPQTVLALASLVARCATVFVEVGPVASTVEAVERHALETTPGRLEVEVVAAAPAMAGDEHVAAVRLGRELVLQHAGRNIALSLNEQATDLWFAVGSGEIGVHELDPMARGVVRDLAIRNFLDVNISSIAT